MSIQDEIKGLYHAYINSDVPHDKIIAQFIKEYGQDNVELALASFLK